MYRRHFQQLLGRAYRSLFDKNTAVELVQQVFTNLLSEDREFATEEKAEKYLYTAFRNLLVDYIRREIRWKYDNLDDVSPRRLSAGARQEEALVSDRLKERQLPLPTRDRDVFEMAYFEGKSDQEIADELRMNIHTLQRSLVRSRRVLAEILEQEQGLDKAEVKRLLSRKKT